MRYFSVFPAVLLAFAVSAQAQPGQDPNPPAVTLYRFHHAGYGEHRQSMQRYSLADIMDARHLASLGYLKAEYNVAVMYYSRDNYASAAHWYRRAADRGHAVAQYNLGVMYYEGKGLPRDYGKAAEWFRKSAQAGVAQAQFELARLYYTGQGVRKDPVEEAHWYRAAAMQKQPLAQYNLAVLLHDGEGVPKDDVAAYAWLVVAQSNGLDTSDARDVVAGHLSADQLAEARRRAEQFMNRSSRS
ncbi:MAG: tetratricopeptide repeat protein [Gammaproteobacteria bacterium]|jgi:TPR repeat protein